MLSDLVADAAGALGSTWPTVPIAIIAAATGLITFVVGFLVGLVYPTGGGSSSTPAKGQRDQSTAGLPPAFRIFRAFSGPVSGTVAGAVLGFYLGGIYGQFVGYPLAGLGFGIGVGLRAGKEWDYWRATFLAGWIGSWVSGVLLYSTRTDLPSSVALPLGANGSLLGFPVTVVAVAGAIGVILSYLTTVNNGWTVGFVTDLGAAAGSLAAGAVWLIAIVALLVWALGSVTTLVPFFKWVVGYTPLGPANPWSGRMLAVELGAFLSLLLASVVLPRWLTLRQHLGEGQKPELHFPGRIAGPWRVLPGILLAVLLAFTGAAAFAGETGTYIGTVTNLGLIVLVAALAGLLVNVAMTRGVDDAPGTEDPRQKERVAFFQTVGGLLYGIITGIAAWGVIFVGLNLYARHPSPVYGAIGLVVGLFLGVVLILLFLGVDRPARPVVPSGGPTG